MRPSPLQHQALRDDLPRYPPLLQLLRVTGTTVNGPNGNSSVWAGSPGLGIGNPTLYVSFVQQHRTDTLMPRDREPCLVNGLGLPVRAGYHLGRLAGSWTGLPVYEVVSRHVVESVCPMILSANMSPLVPFTTAPNVIIGAGGTAEVAQDDTLAPIASPGPLYYWDTGNFGGFNADGTPAESQYNMLVGNAPRWFDIRYDGEYEFWLFWYFTAQTSGDVCVEARIASYDTGIIAGQTAFRPMPLTGDNTVFVTCYGSRRLSAGDRVAATIHNLSGVAVVPTASTASGQSGFGCRMIASISGEVQDAAGFFGPTDFMTGPTGLQVLYDDGSCEVDPNDCCTPPAPHEGGDQACCTDPPDTLCCTAAPVEGAPVYQSEFVLISNTTSRQEWTGTIGPDPTCQFSLVCDGGEWTLTRTGGPPGYICTSTFAMCSPFDVLFQGCFIEDCVSADPSHLANVQFTEAPCGSGSGTGTGTGTGTGGSDCCDGLCGDPGVPATLNATVTAKTGAFTCLADTGTYNCVTVLFSPPRHRWDSTDIGSGHPPCSTFSSQIACQDGMPQLHIVVNLSVGGLFPPDAGWTCNPFSAVYHVDDGAGNSCVITVS